MNASRPHVEDRIRLASIVMQERRICPTKRHPPQFSSRVQARRSGQHPNGRSDMYRVAPRPRLQITIDSVYHSSQKAAGLASPLSDFSRECRKDHTGQRRAITLPPFLPPRALPRKPSRATARKEAISYDTSF